MLRTLQLGPTRTKQPIFQSHLHSMLHMYVFSRGKRLNRKRVKNERYKGDSWSYTCHSGYYRCPKNAIFGWNCKTAPADSIGHEWVQLMLSPYLPVCLGPATLFVAWFELMAQMDAVEPSKCDVVTAAFTGPKHQAPLAGWEVLKMSCLLFIVYGTKYDIILSIIIFTSSLGCIHPVNLCFTDGKYYCKEYFYILLNGISVPVP